jgi:hypothetical protein
MSRPANWRTDRYRRIIQKNGHEDKKGGLPFGLFPPPRPRPCKAAIRAEAERLVAEFEKKKIIQKAEEGGR